MNIRTTVMRCAGILAVLLTSACGDTGGSTDLYKGLLDVVTTSMGQPNYWYPSQSRTTYTAPTRPSYVQPARPVYYYGGSANCSPGPGACASR